MYFTVWCGVIDRYVTVGTCFDLCVGTDIDQRHGAYKVNITFGHDIAIKIQAGL
jgi:hypothetical protein